ncbi:MAG: cytochrome [Rhodobacterales bacterium 32-66-7]|nr:MAG: cytochrome [Rhodobacterales bacterium 32-66-7]
MTPPKPVPRADRVSLWGYLRAFRRDILSAQPARLYRAWMAEFRTPFFQSYLCNDPALVRRVLDETPEAFPKSPRVTAGLAPLLGRSVFVTNGAEWLHQRRIIDPAFEGGRLRQVFPAIWAAAEAAVARMAEGEVEIEPAASHAAADVIFRTLFSMPIEDQMAQAVYHAFQTYQRSAPILNLAAFLPLPRWMPHFHRRDTLRSAAEIRGLITRLTAERARAIAAGTAPDDLATKIMTTPDPLTGQCFATAEMVDQVAIFFLAGHETSASALGWALYLLATHPKAQDRVAAEGAGLEPSFAALAKLRFTRDVLREALRLYPPVPMLVRESLGAQDFRGRKVRKGAQIVISPWHLHRHERIWANPDGFDPDRWTAPETREAARDGYLPFSRGPRVCPGAGFAMLEGTLLLAHLVRAFRFEALPDRGPVPVAHLTVRAKDGIRLRVKQR